MTLNIRTDVDLKNYSGMRLGGKAAYLVEITSRFDVPNALEWAEQRSLPYIVIGQGSNIVWRDEGYQGLVIVNKVKRLEHIKEDEDNSYITLGAGETWDEVVKTSVDLGFADIAPLSLMPGTAGAATIYNINAYGTEISQVLVSVEAYDIPKKQFVVIPSFECGLGKRTSRFINSDDGKYIITGLSLHFTKRELEPPFQGALQHYLTEHGVKKYTAEAIRQSVIAIRTLKFPDPKKNPNCGPFFKNPVISQFLFADLNAEHSNIKYWQLDNDTVKLSATWLLEQTGFANISDEETGIGTWPGQPLILVNNGAAGTHQLEEFVSRIINAVQGKYGVTLEPEPHFLP